MGQQHVTKHLFVSGGVASSLGKGLTASSLGRLLVARGLRVTMQKLDPYLNVDPGTMNPFQHGEVFVTDDVSPFAAHNMLATAKRIFTRHLHGVIAEYEGGGPAARLELDEIKRSLSVLSRKRKA